MNQPNIDSYTFTERITTTYLCTTRTGVHWAWQSNTDASIPGHIESSRPRMTQGSCTVKHIVIAGCQIRSQWHHWMSSISQKMLWFDKEFFDALDNRCETGFERRDLYVKTRSVMLRHTEKVTQLKYQFYLIRDVRNNFDRHFSK